MEEPAPDRKPALIVLAAALAVGALYRIDVAFTDHGIFWPDEIYQSLEPAHRLVFGYGLVPWEFIDGARNWALPGFVALLLKLCSIVGLDAPAQYLGVVRLAFVGIAIGTAYGVYRLAKSLGATELSSAIGASSFALGSLPLYFGHRAMSETASALPVVLGLWLTLRPDATRRMLALGASLLGIAVLLRLQCGVFAAGAVVVLLGRKQWKGARDVFAVLLGWAFVYGLLDKLTWGGWFHSALKYLQFNLVEGRAAGWGVHAWNHLFVHMFTSMTGLSIAFAVGLVISVKRARGLALVTLAFFVLHAMVAHKEMRFIVTGLPLLGACVAIALTTLGDIGKRALGPAVLLAGVVSMFRAGSLTFGDLGAYPDRPQVSAWDDFGPINRLLLAASRQPHVCGVFFEGAHLAWVGGSTYLHHDAPLYMAGMPVPQTAVDLVISPRALGLEVLATDGPYKLQRVPNAACTKDPGYTWRLP